MSEAIWRGLAEKALNGASLETLTHATADGLAIIPLYPRYDRAEPAVLRQTQGAWTIGQRVDHPDVDEANRLALVDLEGGASGLTLVFDGETGRGYGLPVKQHVLAETLTGIELDLIQLRIDAGSRAVDVARLIAQLSRERTLTSAKLSIDLGLDPIGSLARTGRPAPDDLKGSALSGFIAESRAAGLAGTILLADGRIYHEAGAGEAGELAAVLATALAYWRRLEAAGIDLATASELVACLLVADADVFLTMAKFRAMRRLWARLVEACGLAPQTMRLHTETAWRMMTRYAPWINVMRTTAATFAAGTAGADFITSLPFTAALGLPEEGARRLARNMQLMLIGESNLSRVEDPAAGSGALEALTDELCRKAWSLFQEIEREGGIEASLAGGALKARITATRTSRDRSMATLEQAITGTSAFPALDEKAPALSRMEARAAMAPDPLALVGERDAVPFEALRDRVEASRAMKTGAPKVYLATLGTPAAHGPRLVYATNFFAVAGLASEAGDLTAYNGQSPLVCICGRDADYDQSVDEAMLADLRAKGARRILIAGAQRGEPRVGLDGAIHQGCAALDILDDAVDLLTTTAR